MSILITGVAGFIGFHLAQELLNLGKSVFGIDNLNSYYDPQLKHDRLKQLEKKERFDFKVMDIANHNDINGLFAENEFDVVVNLAAQAGVRYSIENPIAYVDSNLIGFANILEGCRNAQVGHLVYASSSSVYGANRKMPFSIKDNVDHPVSLYAATKKSNELMAHAYSHLYQLPVTGLRFFTVYGPWGRPDMAYYKFTRAIMAGEPIDVYNNGHMKRDFTYIDDIVQGVIKLMALPPAPNENIYGAGTSAPCSIYNIGNNQPVELIRFIEILETLLGKKAIKNMLPMQPGDVLATYADISELTARIGFAPQTALEKGLESFVKWYKAYF
ncbi:UDP-glucuronate 4-epimerase [Desulfocicer vacuolatum DSM 3385]|uniref:UDP-glucuronate 4-epimerase n=1 Tax=Desulfocicer vacuolatum DSM 3385 TaxID=1121400 RepID=A0A1W2EVF0_9BACT|nr:NAD-dependent epimerase [Desulfocicer vacuolatum]SMD13138.1 UDP-glucuronate 4-epimerase [Desulfocicer vacuolatum DSM 3385]